MKSTPETIALATTCHKCGKPVSVRIQLPDAKKVDYAQRHAVCTACWLTRSIRAPHHLAIEQARLPYKD